MYRLGLERIRDNSDNFRINFFWNAAGNIAYSISQWLFTIIVTRLVGYSGIGLYSLALAISQAIIGFGLYGMRPYQVTDINNEYTDGEYVASRVISCVAMLPISAAFVLVNQYSGQTALVIFIFSIFRAFEAFIDIFYGIMQRADKLMYVGISFLIRSIFTLLAFTIVLRITKDILSACISLLVVTACSMCLYDIRIARCFGKIKPVFHIKKVFTLLWRCFPLAMFGFLTNYIINIPRYDLEMIISRETLGIFSAIFMPAFVITLFSGLIFQPVATKLAYLFKKKDAKGFVRLTAISCAVVVGFASICLLGSVFFGGTILTILYNKPLQEYSYPFTIILVGVTVSALVQILSAVLTTARRIFSQMIVLVISLCFAFFLSGKLIEANGLTGAAFAYLAIMCVQLLGYLILVIYLIRKIKYNFETEEKKEICRKS